MMRKVSALIGAAFLVVIVGSCHNSDNTVTGPQPIPAMTPTPMPPGSAPTPTPVPPAAQTAIVNVGQGGTNFVDQQSGGSTTTIHPGGMVQWIWVNGTHSTTSGGCNGGGCQPDGKWDSGIGSGMTFSHNFPQAGTFPYHCSVHGAMMQGTIVVQ
jgi:plastocyanin